jgi:peptide/nickel transport system substrate-binding protein
MRRLRTISVAASALVAAVVLAACGSGGSGGSTASGGSNESFNAGVTSVVNPSTHKGGTLTYLATGTPDSLDPGNTYYAYTFNFSRLYATPLLTYKSCPGACSNQIVPGIATGLGTVSDNGLVWTYHIKKGLKFEDGTPVTAADVKYAVERTYDRSVLANGPTYFPTLLADSSYAGPYKDKKGNLTSVTTPDPYTIQFHLKSPFPDFNYVATLPQTAPVPPSKDTGANYQLHPISTGPYEFQSYQLNKTLTLVPNPNWTQNEDPQAKQLPSKIVVDFNVNGSDEDSRLLAGDADLDWEQVGVQPSTRAKLLSNPSLQKYADDALVNRLWFVYLNTKAAPLTNVNCRQAIEYAANKTDLQTALGGPEAGGAVASTIMLPGMPGYNKFDLYEATTKPQGDLTKAKAALAACGKPNGFTVGAAYRADRPQEVAGATALQAALARVGIQLQLHGYPQGSYYTDFAGVPNYVHSHNLGVDFGGWQPDWPDGYGMLDELLNGNTIAPSGNTNISEANNSQINNLFSQAMSPSGSTTAAASDYGQIDKISMQQAYMLPEVYAKALLYRNPDLTNAYIADAFGGYNFAVLGVSNGS